MPFLLRLGSFQLLSREDFHLHGVCDNVQVWLGKSENASDPVLLPCTAQQVRVYRTNGLYFAKSKRHRICTIQAVFGGHLAVETLYQDRK